MSGIRCAEDPRWLDENTSCAEDPRWLDGNTTCAEAPLDVMSGFSGVQRSLDVMNGVIEVSLMLALPDIKTFLPRWRTAVPTWAIPFQHRISIIGILSTLCLTLCNSLQHSARYFRQTLATSVFRLRCHYNCAPCSVKFVRKNMDFVLRVMINTLSSRSFQKHRQTWPFFILSGVFIHHAFVNLHILTIHPDA